MSNLSVETSKQFNYVAQFACIADKCPDTCCAGWTVRIEDSVKELYSKKAPELLDYVLLDEKGAKMKLNSGTCSQLTGGLCHIHKNYGEEYLSDTCSFYPRKVFQVGQTRLMSAEASCPEIARIIMTEKSPFGLVSKTIDRIPQDVTGSLLHPETEKKSLFTMERFIAETEREDLTAEEIMTRIIRVGQILDHIDKPDWANVLDNLFSKVKCQQLDFSGRHPISQYDLLTYITRLCTNGSIRWHSLLDQIDKVFQANVLREASNKKFICIDAELLAARKNYGHTARKIDHALKRFIGSELIRRLFPYGGEKGVESSVIKNIMPVAVFFCIFRTALLAHIDSDGNPPTDENITNIFQTLSREINHLLTPVGAYFTEKGLSDPAVLCQIVNEII